MRLSASLLVVALAFSAPTHGIGSEGASKEVFSVREYWALSGEAAAANVKFDFEVDVTYFDPAWKILFVQDLTDRAAYMPYGSNGYAFEAGRRIRVVGEKPAGQSQLSLENAAISDVGPSRVAVQPVNGRLAEFSTLTSMCVSGHAYVDRMRRLDPTHLELNLSLDGEAVPVWVMVGPAEAPDLLGARIQFEGVFNARIGQDARLTYLEIMIPSTSKITVLGHLDDDPSLNQKSVPIGLLAGLPPSSWVKIEGKVREQDPGHFVRINDATGQIDVLSAQTRTYDINDVVEAYGIPSIDGTSWKLRSALHRFARAASGAEKALTQPELLLASDVLELPPEMAVSAKAVRLNAVVTWSSNDSPFFFVQDSSGGIRVERGASPSKVRSVGRTLDLKGVTRMGPYAPVVEATTFEKTGESALPVARKISLEHALTGAEENQWVELRGYVSSASREGAETKLDLVTDTGVFEAWVSGDAGVRNLEGAMVRLEGVCTAIPDRTGKLRGIRIYVPTTSYVQIEEAAPENPFEIERHAIKSLGQFGTLKASNKRVRVEGIVTYSSTGRYFYIADGDQVLRVLTRVAEPPVPGTKIEVVGLFGRQGSSVLIREAVFRVVGKGDVPAPVPLGSLNDVPEELDGRLVSIEATLLQHSLVGDTFRCVVGNGKEVLEVVGEGAARFRKSGALADDSIVRLIGVCSIVRSDSGAAARFKVLLRGDEDVTVIETPSWFTRQHILALAALVGGAFLLFLGWIVALRKRVQKQTIRIREQLNRETFLETELQRRSKLESLGVLAGGIAHDFNNLLTVMIGNLSLARLDEKMEDETARCLADAERAASRARDLTMQLLTFSKGGAPIRTAVSIPEVIREVADFTVRGSAVKCLYEFPDDTWHANADRGQLGQVVQNVVINAMQAMVRGGTVTIAVKNVELGREYLPILQPGRYVRISFIDTGAGIPQKDLHHLFDPYFTTKKDGSGLGLATVYSIVKKHDGHITVASSVGVGTTITVWLPTVAAGEGPAPTPTTDSASPLAGRAGRILVMDDEPEIIQVAVAMLHRKHHRVSSVPDGAEAVNEYLHAMHVGDPYDLVILDLTVPGGTGGKQALEQLLKLDPGVRAIVSSGYSNDTVLANYRDHGFLGRVTKPYEMDDLLREVSRLLYDAK